MAKRASVSKRLCLHVFAARKHHSDICLVVQLVTSPAALSWSKYSKNSHIQTIKGDHSVHTDRLHLLYSDSEIYDDIGMILYHQ